MSKFLFSEVQFSGCLFHSNAQQGIDSSREVLSFLHEHHVCKNESGSELSAKNHSKATQYTISHALGKESMRADCLFIQNCK